MDTSEEYIKMCNCPEIQEQSQDEDVFCPNLYFRDYGDGEKEFITSHYDNIEKSDIWLPRQDQLQKMVILPNDFQGADRWAEITNFANFITKLEKMGIYPVNATFEQLWLCYVMHELHNKTWNGEEWTQ